MDLTDNWKKLCRDLTTYDLNVFSPALLEAVAFSLFQSVSVQDISRHWDILHFSAV